MKHIGRNWWWKVALFVLLAVFKVEASESSAEQSTVTPCNFDVSEYHIYCHCDQEEVGLAEVVKCQIMQGHDIPEMDSRWNYFKLLNATKSLTFQVRPERALTRIPSPKIFKEMNSLYYFVTTNADFERIPPFAFGNSTTLSELKLVDDKIKFLSRHSFANMDNLTKLNLGDNLIDGINRTVFTNLSKLYGLYLDKNRIQVIHDRAFHELGRLEELDLQYNNLSILASDVFIGLSNLKRLDLRYNAIEYLGEHVFAEMSQLQDLDLMGNKIMSVHSKAFEGLKEITRLNLQENKIVELHPPTFNHLRKIFLLDLRHNELENLSWELIRPIYPNFKNFSTQMMIEGNRFKCDCPLLWMRSLYMETKSLSVKEHLGKTQCNLFQKHAHRSHHHAVKDARVGMTATMSRNLNVTVVAAAPEETTTYRYDGNKSVIELISEDLKCHHSEAGHKKGTGSHGDAGGGTDVTDIESHDESAPSKEVLPHGTHHDDHGSKDFHPATENARAFGDSEKAIQQSHHSLTEASLPDKSSSSSHSQNFSPSSSSASYSRNPLIPTHLVGCIATCLALATKLNVFSL